MYKAFSNDLMPRSKQRGSALIVALALLLLLSGLAGALLEVIRTRAYRAEVDAEDMRAFEAAEAGIDLAIRNLNMGSSGCLGIGWGTGAIGSWTPGMDGIVYSAPGYIAPIGKPRKDSAQTNSSGIAFPAFPDPQEFDFYQHSLYFGDIRFFTYAAPWHGDGLDNDGNGVVDDDGEKDWYTVRSTGFSNPVTPQGKFVTIEAIVNRLTTKSQLQLDAALEIQIAPFKP